MKITIDELINMDKNEMPKRIKIDNDIFIYDNKENDYIYEDGNVSLFNDYIPDIYHLEDLKDALNQHIEILEEEKKIPDKLDKYADISGDLACEWTFGEKKLRDKINEIIDYLEYLKNKGDE